MQHQLTTTEIMQQVLTKLSEVNMDAAGKHLVVSAQQLLKGRALVQAKLNGALSLNLSTFEHLGIVPKDGPTEEQAGEYETFVKLAEQFS